MAREILRDYLIKVGCSPLADSIALNGKLITGWASSRVP